MTCGGLRCAGVVEEAGSAIDDLKRHTINAPEPESRVRGVLICGAGSAGLLFTQYLRNVVVL